MKKLITALITIAMIITMAVPAFADDAGTAATKPGKVQELKVLKNGYKSLKVTWKAVDGASKYQVYRSKTGKSGSFALKKTTTATTYINTGITCGRTYYYKVRAVNSKGKGSFSTVKSNRVQPATVKITKVRPPSDYTNRVYWNKVSGASGYQVYRKRTDKSTWKLMKSVSNKYTYATDGFDFPANEIYYNWEYKVRAYRTVNGKRVYGYFSKPGEWVPDWTIDEIYEELWKYGESLKWLVHEWNGEEIVPKKDGSTYHLMHYTGFYTYDNLDFKAVYTNPANGETEVPAGAIFDRATPKNSSWDVIWPKDIFHYMTKASILKQMKEWLYLDLKSTVKANPKYWEDDWNDWNGAVGFSLYIEKNRNGYRLWGLY